MKLDIDDTVSVTGGPESIEKFERQVRQTIDQVILCVQDQQESTTLLKLERLLWPQVCLLYRLLVALFLASRHQQLSLTRWRDEGWRVKKTFAIKRIKTKLGWVAYGRAYLTRGDGGGWFPLDAQLAITSDGFSWCVVDTVTQLATRISYGATQSVCKSILGWSPSTEAIESLVIGLGSRAPAYMATCGRLKGDGEVLVIELDGKAAPMATDAELESRGKRRKGDEQKCRCQRHRGRKRRKGKQEKRKKRGHNSKNGRSATLVVMYTLSRGEDGKLHGPINKNVWGQFGSRSIAMQWARAQATRRGFGPDTEKRIQVVVDGERCLRKHMQELFPNAIFTLDVRHPQERLWKLGRLFHVEGSDALKDWMKPLNHLLLNGKIKTLLKRLHKIKSSIAKHGPNTKNRRNGIEKEINYLEQRQEMMRYDEFRKQDLVMATGVIEGACRYVIGERLDCSGMRWTLAGAEPLLHLRCIQLNGDWNKFIDWVERQTRAELNRHNLVQLRPKRYNATSTPPLKTAS